LVIGISGLYLYLGVTGIWYLGVICIWGLLGYWHFEVVLAFGGYWYLGVNWWFWGAFFAPFHWVGFVSMVLLLIHFFMCINLYVFTQYRMMHINLMYKFSP
jgi:hypothetical protein